MWPGVKRAWEGFSPELARPPRLQGSVAGRCSIAEPPAPAFPAPPTPAHALRGRSGPATDGRIAPAPVACGGLARARGSWWD